MLSRILLAYTLIFLTSCGTYVASKTTDKNVNKKNPTCKFIIKSTHPEKLDYEEIGSIDYKIGWYVPYGNISKDKFQFEKEHSEKVCSLGGDLVVTELNGLGMIIRATIYKKK